jgi:hypothetical protein
MVAPMVLDGPITNGPAFQAFVEQAPRPQLKRGFTSTWTISDCTRAQASAPQSGRRSETADLPRYCPDFNPIENAFAKLKAFLRKSAERTIDGLWNNIGEQLHLLQRRMRFAAAT